MRRQLMERAQPETGKLLAPASSLIHKLAGASCALARNSVITALRIYKRWISPMLPSACRYHPTCSEYMIEAVDKHGVLRGLWMGLKRLGRCHPFREGGFDPVR